MKIYLAGKIDKNDWRHTIVDNMSAAEFMLEGLCSADCQDTPPFLKSGKASFPILSKVIFGQHDYVGPYFVRCDHGCFHGRSTHGVISCYQEWQDTISARRETVSLCLEAIEKSDLVFAWIDDPSCYGTLTELGLAFAADKQVAIAFPESFTQTRDFWFVSILANPNCLITNAACAKTALQTVLEAFGPLRYRSMPYAEYLKTPHWQQVRKTSLEKSGLRCQVCNSSNRKLNVHHRTYERLGEELEADLIVLCEVCHELFHKHGKLTRK